MAIKKKKTKTMAELRSAYGRPEVEHYDTGNFLINNLCGGGMPSGKVIEFHSDAGFGKTTLLGQILRNMIEKYNIKVAYLDVENAFDVSLREKLGLLKYENDDPNEPTFLYLCPSTYEEVVDTLNAVLSMNYVFVGYDSIANTSLDFSVDDGVELQKKIGQHALLQGEMLKSFKGVFARKGKTLMVINQMRANIQTNPHVRAPALKPAGGKSLDHNFDIRFAISRSDWIVDGNNQKIGSKLKLTTIKNKVALPFKQIELDLYFGYGVDRTATLMQVMLDEAYVVRGGSFYSIPSVNKEEKFNGKDALKSHIRENYDKYVKMVEGKGVKDVDIQNETQKKK